ncbi:MAG: class I SAM-dependent methyltransferase [Planctomycetota bacterium]
MSPRWRGGLGLAGAWLRRVQLWLLERGLRIERARKRRRRGEEGCRFEYQRRYVDFDIPPGARVLDIGSGGDPFPYATVLVDRFTGPTRHRHAPLVQDGREFVEADICALPFADKAFDFVYCAHVLEHVPDPRAACRELMRVGRRGYIETPTLTKDLLFAWGVPDMHRWHVVALANRLCFFELDARQRAGIRTDAWRRLIFGRWEHPLQDAYFENQDVFNVMFLWAGGFEVEVFRLDGSREAVEIGAGTERSFTTETQRAQRIHYELCRL